VDFSNPIVPGTTFIPGLYKVPCLYKADNLLGRMLRSDKRKTITKSRITLSTEAFAKRLNNLNGVGCTTESFIRAGTMALPLMVAIIGNELHWFHSLVELL
jgi:hypothetical protein